MGGSGGRSKKRRTNGNSRPGVDGPVGFLRSRMWGARDRRKYGTVSEQKLSKFLF